MDFLPRIRIGLITHGFDVTSVDAIIIPWLKQSVSVKADKESVPMSRLEAFQLEADTLAQCVMASSKIEDIEIEVDGIWAVIQFVSNKIYEHFNVVRRPRC